MVVERRLEDDREDHLVKLNAAELLLERLRHVATSVEGHGGGLGGVCRAVYRAREW